MELQTRYDLVFIHKLLLTRMIRLACRPIVPFRSKRLLMLDNRLDALERAMRHEARVYRETEPV